MGRFSLGCVASCILIILVPVSSFGTDPKAAMLYTSGTVWVNGADVPRFSSAIFSGDLLETRAGSLANINQPGSIVTVLPDSLVQFQMVSFRIEHGGITVATSAGVTAIAGDVKVAPSSYVWTEFSVTDLDGTVRISCLKGNITVTDGENTVTLGQGEETARDDSEKKKKRRAIAGGVPAAGGALLNTPYAAGIAGATGIGIGIWVLTQGDDPASPSIP